MKLLTLVHSVFLITLNSFAVSHDEKVIATYNCKVHELSGNIPSEYSLRVGDDSSELTVFDSYEPSLFEKWFGYPDSYKIPTLRHGEDDYILGSSTSIEMGEYGSMFRKGWSDSTSTVLNYYSTCFFSTQPCELGYSIYSESGINYALKPYEFISVSVCVKN